MDCNKICGKKYVLVYFPHCGLGNKLVIWSRAALFAQKNNLPLIVFPWWGFHLGAILRNDRKKRFYFNMLKHTNVFIAFIAYIRSKFSNTVYSPPLDFNTQVKSSEVYVFDTFNLDNDIFGYIRNDSNLIRIQLNNILTKKSAIQLNHTQKPFIGVHVRRGDFVAAGLFTPISFFVKAINFIREVIGRVVPVTVFTDGTKEELKELLILPNVNLAEENCEIVDILLLSQSKLLILSRKSSFSYWAAYLSNAIVVKHTEEWQQQIKNNSEDGYTEIFMDEGNLETFEINLRIALVKIDLTT